MDFMKNLDLPDLPKEAKSYFKWFNKHPIKPVSNSVSEEGAGSELRSPLMHFGTVAPVYLAVIGYLRQLHVDKTRLIELGCGTGRFLSYIKLVFPTLEVWGVDYSAGVIDYAKKNYGRFGVKFKHTPAQSTELKANHFDFVISSHVIEHIKKNEGLAFMKECERLLKKGGYVFIGTPERKKSQDLYMKNPTDDPKKRLTPPHEHEYTLLELKTLARRVFEPGDVRIDKLHNHPFYKVFVSSVDKMKPKKTIINTFTNFLYPLIRDKFPKNIFDFIVRIGLDLNLKYHGTSYQDILMANTISAESDKETAENLFLICKK